MKKFLHESLSIKFTVAGVRETTCILETVAPADEMIT